MQKRVSRVPIRNTDELRQWLVATWTEFQQSMVDDTIDQWQKWLEACVRADGTHFECFLAIDCLTISSCHTSQPVLYRATKSHQHLEENNIPSIR